MEKEIKKVIKQVFPKSTVSFSEGVVSIEFNLKQITNKSSLSDLKVALEGLKVALNNEESFIEGDFIDVPPHYCFKDIYFCIVGDYVTPLNEKMEEIDATEEFYKKFDIFFHLPDNKKANYKLN